MNNVLDVGDIQSTRRDIRGDQERILLGGKSLDILQSLPLRHRSVQRKRGAIQHDEQRDDATNAVDAVAENDGASRVLLEEVKEILVLLFERTVEPVFWWEIQLFKITLLHRMSMCGAVHC